MLSCHEKNDTPVVSDYEVINSWIEENMKRYYLWNERIRTDGINKNENPERHFQRLIVPEDSCSYVEDNIKLLLIKLSENKKPGYAYFLYSTDGDVLGKITYVVNKSPADEAGLKRGMVFTKINGTSLSKNNCQDLILQMVDRHILTVRDKNSAETNYEISIAEFAESPVFLDTVYDFDSRRIGYLVYNSFISDNNDLSQEYDMLLNDVFEKFKNRNINELILDLRYNSKGDIMNSMIMASLIVPNPDTKEIFAKYQYNKYLQQTISEESGADYLNLYYTNVIDNKALNNIGNQLDRVFVLTSSKTGVMGEILVNGLKLSMNVVVVGNKTAGRNMFSICLYEDEPEKQRINNWAIVPVVMQVSNKAGNTDISITPDVEITEPLYDDTPLGDINEKVLSATLNIILGN
jgi:C-terminal processing protease CtpA/Prc